MQGNAYILSGIRTPIGSLGGTLSTVSAPELGAICIRNILETHGVKPGSVDEVIMGNVVSAGLGQNPARQAAIHAGVPVFVGAVTVNKVCGSGLKAVMLAVQSIRLGDANLVVAGGMENMSRAPYLLPEARAGYRLGNGTLVDSMIHDGLWDVYSNKHMGEHGDRCAVHCKLTRHDQDEFAIRSYTRARMATETGIFAKEIVPVEVRGRKQSITVDADEGPARFDEQKLRALKPAFGSDGTITAGNASSINDGAAALVLASQAACERQGIQPVARIVDAYTFSREPEWFTLAPIGALRGLFEKIGWTVGDTDLFEINEAFAVVTLAAERDLKIPEEKINIYGGAVALGHPIGCTGARILVTLLNGLKQTNGKRGIVCLCIGGGEAIALAVEMI